MNAKQIWQTTIERLQTKVSSAVFTTWFQGTSALSFQDGVFIVRVPTTFAKAHLEGRFLETIRSILSEVTGTTVEVQFIVAKEVPEPKASAGTEESPSPKRTYRLSKGRFAAALREKRASTNASAINSMAPTSPAPAPAYRSVQHERPKTPALEEKQNFDEERELRRPREKREAREHSEPQEMRGTRSFRETREQRELQEIQDHQENHLRPPKQMAAAHPVQEYSPTLPAGPSFEGLLNPRYTFSSFIVGKSNQFGHAASLAVSENPGRIYNPLFLYGGVGLGKTHLLHAIGHAGEEAGLNVLYVTSEKFTNEIINAIRFQKTEEFRAKYRQIDILLVDDIQFIAGKESTEEEFFHTFNTLHNANKQIVVTSDRPPKAISSLQDRLRSRFEWGLLADVQAPEYDHRLAILRSKAESLRFTVPAGVLEYVARPECSSVRELEGALNRVIAYATLHDAPLTVPLAAQALEHIYDKKVASNLTVSEVLDGVSRYYSVDATLLRGKQRDRDIVWPRQVAMYIMREETSASLLQIGSALGGRDHTTIMHGWEKVHTEMTNNDQIRQEIAAVLESFQHH
ncbi:chromosomal replication initiator protein DnaA [Tengunoibacter tsumagoiensis]|uniref:Chromosomal replication initiator protein DnaA n=1 Tax=Tengunoibacter tsumagoiensis TaxID=2014871 RepID=A0A402A465_9CHLR|nr:chromosomal replication initiator protein DnaA [Tengunoibacter tsumagoiensis]GCE13928.1 hypothetical protein KTT_37870 [Tengunoibacter tsumagoiensis]